MTIALERCFPLVRVLDPTGRDAFNALVHDILGHRCLDLRLFGRGRRELPVTEQARLVIGGHIAELFFYRRDILAAVLSQPRHFWLYDSPAAYAEDGGIAGGQFDAGRGAVMLVQSRLAEGMGGDWPGVAPFLHEFGHMLDFIDGGSGAIGASHGLIVGLAASDGPVFTPGARSLFARGKHLEMQRYAIAGAARAHDRAAQPLPLGHPYVFQNDTEFCAGYLEMWLRNPNAFAHSNPDLFGAYVALFGWDPRAAWPADFSFYVEQNRAYYLSGQPTWPTSLTHLQP